MPAQRVALIIEYDGTLYAGSQRQAGNSTVQACLEEAMLKLTGEEIKISLAGRTDAGVHARGQVGSFSTKRQLPLTAFIHGLNFYLPADIAINGARTVHGAFDPRRQAISREYEYLILNRATRSPLWRNRAYHVACELNLESMNEAASTLIGRHDFASFTTDMKSKSTVRHVYKAGFRREDVLVIFLIAGNAFLPHQVRRIVATLLKVGQGKLAVPEFYRILQAHKAGLADLTAPACGLYLNKVVYNNYEGNYENI
jgi:tRNA pseudouridine38-40 synthase